MQDGFRVVLLGLLGARLRTDPHLLSFHARALEAFARYLELAPDLVPLLIDKVRSPCRAPCDRGIGGHMDRSSDLRHPLIDKVQGPVGPPCDRGDRGHMDRPM